MRCGMAGGARACSDPGRAAAHASGTGAAPRAVRTLAYPSLPSARSASERRPARARPSAQARWLAAAGVGPAPHHRVPHIPIQRPHAQPRAARPLLQPCAAAPSLRAARESARWGAHNASQKQTNPIVRVGTGTGPHLRRTGVLVLAQTRSRAGGPAHAALMTGVYTDASRMPLRTPHARPTSMPAVPVVSGFGTCRWAHLWARPCAAVARLVGASVRGLRCAHCIALHCIALHCPSVRSVG